MKTYFPVAVALLVGVALGFCLSPSAPAPTAVATAEESAKERPLQDEGDKSSTRALRARIRELEGLLAKQGAGEESAKEDDADRIERRERRFDPRAEMERIKKEDPARFAQITNGMAMIRRQRLERAQTKMDFLGSVDTSKMTAAARQTHEALQDMIERREELEDKMRNFMDMSEEARRSVMDEMRETEEKIRDLNKVERYNLLVQTASALGFEGDDAIEIIDTVKSIYEATESGFGFGPGGPGGHRRGRGR
jgi:gas vesicle protein